MGAEMLAKGAESGEVLCHGCQHLLGVWTWNPSDKHSFNGSVSGQTYHETMILLTYTTI
jgi:hypothetical protein